MSDPTPISLSLQEAGELMQQLQLATEHHLQWLERLTRTMACNLEPDPADLAEDAHRRCRFGHWYYGQGSATLAEDPEFRELGSVHEAMHRAARDALEDLRRRGAVEPAHYDEYKALQQRLIESLGALQAKIHVLDCPTDPLTGVCARQGMTRRLREEQSRSERLGQKVSLVLLDLDHFKQINDTYGHLEGDRVLRTAAQRVLRQLRPYDRMYRFGGEEFLLCLSDTDQPRAADIAERLRQALAERPVRLRDGHSLEVHGSFGVTELHPDESVDEAIHRADEALYAAKAAGRNRVRVRGRD